MYQELKSVTTFGLLFTIYSKIENLTSTCLYISIVTPCEQNKCENGATCEADPTESDGYRCNCDTGYSGDRCEGKCADDYSFRVLGKHLIISFNVGRGFTDLLENPS